MKTYTSMEPEAVAERWDATVAAVRRDTSFDRDRGSGYGSYGDWWAGIVRRPTGLFLPGDNVVMVVWNGGGERQPCWSKTRRGYLVRRHYQQYARYRTRRSAHLVGGRLTGGRHHLVETTQLEDLALVMLIEPPGEGGWLDDEVSLFDPAVRRHVVESTCAWYAANRVGAGSPAGAEGQRKGEI